MQQLKTSPWLKIDRRDSLPSQMYMRSSERTRTVLISWVEQENWYAMFMTDTGGRRRGREEKRKEMNASQRVGRDFRVTRKDKEETLLSSLPLPFQVTTQRETTRESSIE